MRHLAATNDKSGSAGLLLLALFLFQALGLSFPLTAAAVPPKLRPETQEAFDRYIKLTEARNEAALKRGTRLLWLDVLPESQRSEAYTTLRNGEVRIEKLETRDNNATIRCPGGMIHHWTGAVFIPGAKLEDVLLVLEDYDRHSSYFAPDVERSKLESRNGDHFKVFLRFRRHKVITVVLNTEHEVDYFYDRPGGAHSRSSAVRIAEVENPGKSNEHEKTPGDDGGYLWRMETWWRMREADGGVYVESEVVSLTRDIPTGLGWLIGPFVTGIPKETLAFTLETTRKAVQTRKATKN